MNAEQKRLEENKSHNAPWHFWGPYLAERAWGTVREDYSANGDAWNYFPHRSRPVARLSLERRRNRRDFRLQRQALSSVRVLERARSVLERALVRPVPTAGKSRRGREGTLLVHRQHSDAQFHADGLSLSANAFSLRGTYHPKRRAFQNGRRV